MTLVDQPKLDEAIYKFFETNASALVWVQVEWRLNFGVF